jgi:hypothetical protein
LGQKATKRKQLKITPTDKGGQRTIQNKNPLAAFIRWALLIRR